MSETSSLLHDIRRTIDDFLAERLMEKTKKLNSDNLKDRQERIKQEEKFSRATWVADAARRVAWIQGATHVIKGVHSSAKGTNLFCPSHLLMRQEGVVGSHLLQDYQIDVVGNAAALDVNKFFNLECRGKTLLQWMQSDKETVVQALEDESAEDWVDTFCAFTEQPQEFITHTFAKQIYWLMGDNPVDDKDFILLAPLYPSSFVHNLYTQIQEDRFGEQAKEARKARKDNVFCENQIHNYPQLALQKLGGSNKQNVSQLNSERGGKNYLLGSCPPLWQTREIRPIYSRSFFKVFGKRKEIRKLFEDLRLFLESDPAPTIKTREKRDGFVSEILAELFQFIADLLTLPPGWTQDERCKLAAAQRCLLDPFFTKFSPDFADFWVGNCWEEEIERQFASWFNEQLNRNLPLGDAEHKHWKNLFSNEAWRQVKKEIRQEVKNV